MIVKKKEKKTEKEIKKQRGGKMLRNECSERKVLGGIMNEGIPLDDESRPDVMAN